MMLFCAGVFASTVALAVVTAPIARADAVAYLVHVEVRPGYSFPNPDAALSYGLGICQEIADGRRYADILHTIRSELTSSDEYQAANELCPQLIWQLRNSAANYHPTAP